MENTFTTEQIKAMTREERANLVESTKTQLEEAYAKAEEMNDKVHKALIKELNFMTAFKIKVNKPYIIETYRKEKGAYQVCTTISFILPEDEREANNNRETDFGSSFDLDIYESHIKVNHGSIGSFTSKDKYQLARLALLTQLFTNEQTCVAAIKEIVDMSIYEETRKLCRIIDEVKYTNRREDDEAKREAAISQLKVGAIFKQTEFHEGEGCGWFFKITSVTDKTVICEQLHKYFDYDWENHCSAKEATYHHYNGKRLNKADFIAKVANGSYVKEAE